MRCGYHNSRLRLASPYRPRKTRCRHKLAVYVDLDAVSRKHSRSLLGKYVRLYSRIKRDSYRSVLVSIVDIVCKTLRCTPYSVYVEPVCARADNTAQTARAEFKIAVEPVLDSLCIARYLFKLFYKILVLGRILAPQLVEFHFSHCQTPLISISILIISIHNHYTNNRVIFQVPANKFTKKQHNFLLICKTFEFVRKSLDKTRKPWYTCCNKCWSNS